MRVHQLSNPALGLAGISLFVFTIYATSLGNPFQYDDAHSIVDNRHIQSLANIPSFFADPTMFSEDAASAMYRPLILVSYGLNHALGGYEPEGYHLVNLFVHLANLVLVYVLVRLLGRTLGVEQHAHRHVGGAAVSVHDAREAQRQRHRDRCQSADKPGETTPLRGAVVPYLGSRNGASSAQGVLDRN